MGSDFEETMNHPCHLQHPIILKSEGAPFQCSGCEELGLAQGTSAAKLIVPSSFTTTVPQLAHRPPKNPPVHGEPTVRLPLGTAGRTEPPICDACGQDVRGFLYHDQCSKHKFDLHPCCMNLKRTMSDPSGTVELNRKDKAPPKCVKCKRKYLNNVQSKEAFRGWSYVSSCGTIATMFIV
ncbi:uncharacterized protein LOC129295113 [Prosopis cineraria]|uniref:uncharacterized protein LOC129295113 n=1 Tax=Prosopis cineraria TaxID=364024 RepID=UPI00241096FF|nr:uncharacterized protein LOC129295113 [Prosopis cineraria]